MQRVVAAVDLAEEDMAGQFDAGDRVFLEHHALHVGVPALAAQGRAAMRRDRAVEMHRTLDVEDDVAVAGRHRALEQDHREPFGSENAALVVDHGDPVAVAVEADAEVGALVDARSARERRGSRPRRNRGCAG